MRGSLVKRGRSWSAVLYLGKDESTGKKRYRWIKLATATRTDAETQLTELLHQQATATLPAPSSLTVGAFLARWLEHAKTTVRVSTYEKYDEVVRVYLTPHLGQVRLQKLSPLAIQTAYGKLLEAGGRHGRPLSARSVQHAHAVLHRALTMAVKWKLLTVNPADAVEAPRPARREVGVLDEHATRRLLKVAAGTVWHLPLLLAATTGARRSELLGIKWADLDLAVGRLIIARSLIQTKADEVQMVPPKSGKPRTVALPAVAVKALTAHRKAQAAAKRAQGPAYQDHDLVLARPDGTPWPPESFTSGFRAWARRHGFAGLKFHALRHGHATHLLRAGVSIKAVSARLGHSTVALTGDVYGHLLGGEDAAAAASIDAALGSKRASIKTRGAS